jgi:hypothetical protein
MTTVPTPPNGAKTDLEIVRASILTTSADTVDGMNEALAAFERIEARFARQATTPELILEAMATLPWQERERLFETLIPGKFCRWCGSDNGNHCCCHRDD